MYLSINYLLLNTLSLISLVDFNGALVYRLPNVTSCNALWGKEESLQKSTYFFVLYYVL